MTTNPFTTVRLTERFLTSRIGRSMPPRHWIGLLLCVAWVSIGLGGAAIKTRASATPAPLPARIIILATRAPAVRDKPIEPQAAPTVAPTPIPATPEPIAAPPTAAPEIIYSAQAAPPTAAPIEEPTAEAWHPPMVLPLSDEQAREWAGLPPGWHPPMALPAAVECVQTKGGGMCVEEDQP